MYTVKVNQQYDFKIQSDENGYLVNDKHITLDQQKLDGSRTHVIYEGRSYKVELISLDKVEKTASVKVNGNVYQITVKDRYDELLKQLGMDNLAVNKVQQIKAPMPGLVLHVLVQDGDEVKKGDNLLVLEAMKMENMIKSPADGIIKKVAVINGDKVEKNEVLISF